MHLTKEIVKVVLVGSLPVRMVTELVIIHLRRVLYPTVLGCSHFLFCLLIGKVLADLSSISLANKTAPCRDILNDCLYNLFLFPFLLDDGRLFIGVRLLRRRVLEPPVPHFVDRVDLLLAEAHPLEQLGPFADSLH